MLVRFSGEIMQSLPTFFCDVRAALFFAFGMVGGFNVALGQPANDAFVQRELLAVLPNVLRYDTHGATAEPGEPWHSGLPRHTVWWTWTAPSNGFVRISEDDGPLNYTVVVIYSGNVLSELRRGTFNNSLALWQVKAGETYQIAASTMIEQEFEVRFTYFLTQINDAFASRLPLPQPPFSLTSDISVATLEPNEPRLASGAEHSLWFFWTAPADGRLHLFTSNQFITVDAFQGEALDSLVAKPVSRSFSNYLSFDHSFSVNQGEAYQIALGRNFSGLGHPPEFYSAVLWAARFDTVPSNGVFQSRTLLLGDSGEFTANGYLFPGNILWYEWIAPTNGTLFVGGATAYFGDNPSQLVSLDNQYSGTSVTQGMSIKLSVFAPSATRVAYRFYESPTNDFFAAAHGFAGNSVHLAGHNYGAGLEKGEPRHGNEFAGRSIWYRWTATTNGWTTWRVWTPGYTPSTKVYEGTVVSLLKRVVNQSQVGSPEGLFALYEFRAIAGRTYCFVVDNQRTRAEEGRGYYVNPPGTFDMEFTFTTLQLQAEFATVDGAPVLTADFGAPDPEDVASVQASEYGLVYLDRFCPTLPVTANEPGGFLRWTNPPPGRYLLTCAVSNQSGGAAILSPINLRIPPPNDDLANAEIVDGFAFTRLGIIAGAGRESREPSHGGSRGLGSIWWKWTAPADGQLELGLTVYGHRYGYEPSDATGIFPSLAVYLMKGERLVRVAGAKRARYTVGCRLRAEKGGTYLIAGQIPSGYYLSDCAGNAELRLRLAAAKMASSVAGKTFRHRTPISLAIDANFPVEEIEHVEFVEAQEYGRLPIVLLGTNASPFAAVWEGAPKGPHKIAARVHRKDGHAFTTDFVELFVQTANDNFADALVLDGIAPTIQDDVAYATREPGEPNETGRSFGDSVWYRWTAPRSGRCLVQLIGFGEAVYFYTGSSVSRLQRVAAQRNDAATLYWFDSIAGTTYHIAVKRNVLWPVPFELSILPGDPPSNDAFSQAEPVAPDATHILGTLRFGTVELGEPGGQIDSSAWFAWTAPADGVVAFKRPWPAMDLQLYAGSSLTVLEPLADLTDPRDFQWRDPWRCYRVRAQQTCHLQVSGRLNYGPNHDPYWDMNANRFNVEMRFTEPPGNDSFGNPFELPAGSTMFVGESLGASSELGDVMNGLSTAVTLWWNWRAPADGRLTMTFSNLFLSAFRGDTLATLQQLTGNLSPSSTEVRVNETLRLCAYHWNQYPGTFGFQLDFQPGPAGTLVANTNVTSNFPTLDASARLVVEGQSTRAQGSEANSWAISGRLLPSTTVEFFVTGEPGRRFLIQSSSDLNIWQDIQPSGTTTMTAGGVRLTAELNPQAASFFRVKAIE